MHVLPDMDYVNIEEILTKLEQNQNTVTMKRRDGIFMAYNEERLLRKSENNRSNTMKHQIAYQTSLCIWNIVDRKVF